MKTKDKIEVAALCAVALSVGALPVFFGADPWAVMFAICCLAILSAPFVAIFLQAEKTTEEEPEELPEQ